MDVLPVVLVGLALFVTVRVARVVLASRSRPVAQDGHLAAAAGGGHGVPQSPPVPVLVVEPVLVVDLAPDAELVSPAAAPVVAVAPPQVARIPGQRVAGHHVPGQRVAGQRTAGSRGAHRRAPDRTPVGS